MEINHYRKHVRDLAAKRDGTPVYNSSLDHAAVLAETMFEFGHKEVCILSGKLNANVYGTREVVDRAKIFLADPATKVRIIVENPQAVDLKEHPFLAAFSNDRTDLEIRSLTPEVAQKTKFHYMVMDSDSYRFESNKNEPSAIAAFGDKKGGENLMKVFESLWNSSNKLV